MTAKDSVSKIIATGVVLLAIQQCFGAVPCPSGDSIGVIKDGMTCAELVTSSTKRECYDTAVETSCCDSCNAVAITIPDCTYGDGVSPCFDFICSSISNPTDCCETCAAVTTDTATSTTTPATIASTTESATPIATTEAITEAHNDAYNVGAIVGGVIGGLVGTAIVGVGLYAGYTQYKRFRKQQVHNKDSDSSDTTDVDSLPHKGPITPVPPIIVTDPAASSPLPPKDELITKE